MFWQRSRYNNVMDVVNMLFLLFSFLFHIANTILLFLTVAQYLFCIHIKEWRDVNIILGF